MPSENVISTRNFPRMSGRGDIVSCVSSPRGRTLAVLFVLGVIAGGARLALPRGDSATTHVRPPRPAESVPTSRPPSHPTPAQPRRHRPTTAGPINTTFAGLTTFRGNATRDYYGEGPLPRHPVIRWRAPATGGLCSRSSDLF